MAETSKVIAKKRDRAGKGGARSSRRDGLIPAVIYGDKQPPLMIAVEPKSVERELHKEGFFNHQLKIDVEGTGYDVLPRDVQVDPVTDKPLHLDFMRIGPDSIITVQVPVHFKNESAAPGIKRGGILNVIRHAITVRTRADHIPEFFEILTQQQQEFDKAITGQISAKAALDSVAEFQDKVLRDADRIE